MTLLRELIRESALIPGHYDDAFPGGGSSFAHLVEDTGESTIFADWPIAVMPVGSNYLSGYAYLDPAGSVTAANDTAETFATLLASGAISSRVADANVAPFDAGIAGDVFHRIGWGFAPTRITLGDGTSAPDVRLERNAADVLTLGEVGAPDTLELFELAGDVAAPNANGVRFYAKDVGGKTALFARFPTGAVQQIAIEP